MATVDLWDYIIEIGRCCPGPNGQQLWFFQVWGSSLYPWYGGDGYDSADEAMAAAFRWYNGQ